MILTYDVISPFTGNGVDDTFTFDFLITDLADLKIIILDADGDYVAEYDGNDTTFIDSVDYNTVEGGGTVYLIDPLATDYEIFLILAPDQPTQDSRFRDKSEFSLRNFEQAFDYAITCIQRLFSLTSKSVRLPEWFDSSDFDPTLPASLIGSANTYVQTNSTGTGWNSTGTIATDAPLITGSRTTPEIIVAATGIEFVNSFWFNHWYVKGSGGGSIVSANPQIAEATNVGQRLKITGTSDADYVELSDGNGLITGGQTLRLGNNSVVVFEADENLEWVLESTNGLV